MNDPVHLVLRVGAESFRSFVGSPKTGLRLFEADDHMPPTMVRQRQQGFRELRFVFIVLGEIQPALDLNIECFLRIAQQILKPTAFLWYWSVHLPPPSSTESSRPGSC